MCGIARLQIEHGVLSKAIEDQQHPYHCQLGSAPTYSPFTEPFSRAT